MMSQSFAGYLRGVLIALVIMISGPVMAQEHVTLPGNVWAIIPPPGFSQTTDPIVMFRHDAGGVIITLDGPNEPFDMAEFRSLPVSGREVPATEVSEIVVNGKRAILGLYDDREGGNSTMVLAIEGDRTNGYVTAIIPDAARAKIPSDDIRTALLTAIESPAALQDQMAGFPFSIDDMGDFRIAARVAGMSLIMTDGPSEDMDKVSGQSFVSMAAIGTGTSSVDLARDLEAMAAQLKQDHPGARFEKGRILTTVRGEVAEFAYERELPDGGLVAGVIWARPMGNHLVLVLCQYPPGDDAALRRLESLRDSLRESEQ